MAVVTTTFTSTAGQNWASSTWSSSDPSKKLHDELVAWVNAINDPTKIEMIHNPGDATARGSTDYVRWLLRAREAETGSDYGIKFVDRYAGTGLYGNPGIYYSRTSGSSNNGSGAYSTLSPYPSGWGDFSQAYNHFVAYDATGSTPWLVYAAQNSGTTASFTHILSRVTTQNIGAGSYYPASGLGKWIYAMHNWDSWTNSAPTIVTPQSSLAAPYRGVNAASNSSSPKLRYPQPATTTGDGYFFKLGAQYGDTHFLGEPTYDILVSNTATGVWGDTVVIDSVTYQRLGLGAPFWVRIS